MRLTRVAEKQINNEPLWHIVVTIVVAIGLQLLISDKLAVGSKYALGGLEVLLLIVLVLPFIGSAVKRLVSIGLIGLITVCNLASLALVVRALVSGQTSNGLQLLLSSVAIYLTNIIVFGLLFAELDESKQDEPDFLFPQFASGDKKWQPTFLDYLYVSITNATAFSPTDTLPLTHRAKLLMSVQGITALITIALVTARAVNILG